MVVPNEVGQPIILPIDRTHNSCSQRYPDNVSNVYKKQNEEYKHLRYTFDEKHAFKTCMRCKKSTCNDCFVKSCSYSCSFCRYSMTDRLSKRNRETHAK